MEKELNKITTNDEAGFTPWQVLTILPPTEYSTDFRIVCFHWALFTEAEPTETAEARASVQVIGEPAFLSPAE